MQERAARKPLRWSTRLRLLWAGWRPHRDVWDRLQLPKSLPVFPEARRVLAEFGGLRFGDSNEHVCLDPGLAEEAVQVIGQFAAKLGTRLYPIGMMEHQDVHFLLVDERGFVHTLISFPLKTEVGKLAWYHELEPLASSFEQALGYLVRKSHKRRDRENDLRSIRMLGKTWKLQDDSYRPS